VVPLALERVAGSSGVDVSTPSDPATVLAGLADLAEAGTAPSPRLLDAIEAAVPREIAWDGAARDGFFRLLRAGGPGIRMLEVLDRMGLLVRFLPAWTDVRCRPQRDPYHRLTVDAHLLAAATAAYELLHDAERPSDAPPAADRDGFLLGALLHDIGKVGRADHVALGTEITADLLDHMGVDPSIRELVSFMASEHLLLPDTATRRDLSDEDLVLDVAARVGTRARLSALALLAEADARATGPAAATQWRRALVSELVTKVGRVLERGEMGEELAVRLATRIGRVRELLADEPEAAVDRFVLGMPRRYFLAVHPERIRHHFALISPALEANEVRVWSEKGIRPGSHEILVVAGDRPGLLSWIAGALTLERLSILSAQAFTTEDGAAVDLFEVAGSLGTDQEASRQRIAAILRGALDGTVSIEQGVELRRRHYPPPRRPVPVTVRVDEDASDFSTVIEVGAADRIGLLHDITRALAELHVDVHLAKVATFDGRVVDTFYVRDALGRKIVEEAALAELSDVVRRSLGS
jgi:[protein-PII] uridylyltransferase